MILGCCGEGCRNCCDGCGSCGDGFGFMDILGLFILEVEDLDLWMFWVCCNSRRDAGGDASPVQLFNLHENQQEMQAAHGKGTLTSS